jgi:hypothetical protein
MGELSVAVLCLTGCVFAASATAKLRGRTAYLAFLTGLRDTKLVPGRLLSATAAALCAVESVVAAGLVAACVLTATAWPGRTVLAGSALAAAAALTTALAVGIGLVIRRGTQARCACFGAGSGSPIGRVHLIRNLGLLAMQACGLACCALGSVPSASGAVLAALAGAVGALLAVRLDDILGLFASAGPPAPGQRSW